MALQIVSCSPFIKVFNFWVFSFILQWASTSALIITLRVTINEVMGTAWADIAATHSIAGLLMNFFYQILKKQGIIFTPSSFLMTLVNGSKIKREIQTTRVKIHLGGLTLPLNLAAIPEAKGNTIQYLWIDFLESSGIILNLKQKTWFFSDQPKRQFHFVEQIQEWFPYLDCLGLWCFPNICTIRWRRKWSSL